jgi:hypothetical protein
VEYLGSQMKFNFLALSDLVFTLCTTKFNTNVRSAQTIYLCI